MLTPDELLAQLAVIRHAVDALEASIGSGLPNISSDEWVTIDQAAGIANVGRRAMERRLQREPHIARKVGGRVFVAKGALIRPYGRLLPDFAGSVQRSENDQLRQSNDGDDDV